MNVNGNNTLTSLAGLDNIDAGSISDLYIYDNNSLSTCEVQSICDYLAAPFGTVEIHDNAPGCINPEEVEQACSVGLDDAGISETIFPISPNPASGYIIFESGFKGLFTLTDLQGRQLIARKLSGPTETIDIRGLPPGIYIVGILGETLRKEKLITL